MKPVRIDFVQRRAWRIVWVVAAVLCIAIGTTTAWRWQKSNQELHRIRDQISVAEQETQRLRAPVHVQLEPRQASIDQAVKLLRLDWNKVFATIENLREPGVHLRGLALDVASNTARLGYDLDSMVKVPAVTAALNGGFDVPPWRLESVSGTNAPGTTTPGTAARAFHGVWSATLEKL